MAKEVLNPVQPEMSDFVEDASDPKEDKEAAPAKPAKKKYKTPKNPRSKHLKKLFARVKETGSSADRLTHSIIDEASAAFSFYTPMERIEVLLALESEFCGGKSKKTANLRNRRRAVFRGLIRLECVRHASLSENAFHLFRLLAERKINMTKLVESLDNSSKSKTGPGSKGKSMKEVFLLCFAGKGKKDAELQEALESEELTVQFEEAFALFQEWCNMPVILATPRSPLRHELADRIAACKEKLLNDEQINLQFEDISLLKSPSKSLHFAVLQFYFSYLRNLRDPQESEATAANDPTDDRMSFAMEFLELLNEDSSGYEKGSPPPPPPPPLPQQQRFANLNVGTGMTFNVNTTATSPANAEDFRLCYEALYSPPTENLSNHPKRKRRFAISSQSAKKMHLEEDVNQMGSTRVEGENDMDAKADNGKENLNHFDEEAFWEMANASPTISSSDSNTRPATENMSDDSRSYQMSKVRSEAGGETHVLKLPINHGVRRSVRRLRDILNETTT